MLVSAIVLVAMLMIYRNTIQNVAPSSEGARVDGEIVSGLLAAHVMLHDAGFGIGGDGNGPEYGTHLRVLSGATLSNGSINGSVADEGNAVIWTKQINGDDFCEGLFADGEGGLWRVSSSSTSCTDISSGIDGTASPLIQPSRHPDGGVDAITFTYSPLSAGDACRPLGIGAGIAGIAAITITVENSTGHDIGSTTCLANFQ